MLPSELFHETRGWDISRSSASWGVHEPPRCVHLRFRAPRSWPKSHSTLGGLTCLEVPVRCFPGESWKRIKCGSNMKTPSPKPDSFKSILLTAQLAKKCGQSVHICTALWLILLNVETQGAPSGIIRSPSPFQTFPNTLQGPSCRGCACICPPWYPPCHRPDSALATANFHGRNTSEHILGSAACDGQSMEQICRADPSGFGLQGIGMS